VAQVIFVSLLNTVVIMQQKEMQRALVCTGTQPLQACVRRKHVSLHQPKTITTIIIITIIIIITTTTTTYPGLGRTEKYKLKI
jgi:hypothetical protein